MTPRNLLLLAMLLVGPEARAEETPVAFLKQYCVSCHNTAKHRGDLNLEARLAGPGGLVSVPGEMKQVGEAIETGTMPPSDATQPTAAERKAALMTVKSALAALREREKDDPGRVVVPRLNRAEYDRVIADLTGHDLKPAKYFPADPLASNGFSNVGEVLGTGSDHVESWLAAAKFVLSHARITPERGILWFPQPAAVADTPDEYRKAVLSDWLQWHVRRECLAFGETDDEPFSMERAAKRVLRLADYWEAAWRVRNRNALGQPDLTPEVVAKSFTPPLVAPVLHGWLSFFATEQPPGLASFLVEDWKALPAPGPKSGKAVRGRCEGMAEAFASRLKPIWNKRWFETRTGRPGEFPAEGPGEASQPRPKYLYNARGERIGSQGRKVEKPSPESEKLLSQGRYDIEVNLEGWKATTLYLVATDAADGSAGDGIEWQKPRFDKHSPLGNITVTAPKAVAVAIPKGAKRFFVTAQLDGSDRKLASVQVMVMDREPTAEELRWLPNRYVITWREGAERARIGLQAWTQLTARSTKAAEGLPAKSLLEVPGVSTHAFPKFPLSTVEFPESPYHLDPKALVSLADEPGRAERGRMAADVAWAAQEPWKELDRVLSTCKVADHREGVVPDLAAVPATSRDKVRAAVDSARQFEDRLAAKVPGILEPVLRTLWRRPITPLERERFADIYRADRGKGASFDAAVKRALTVAMLSPDFLYRLPESRAESKPQPLSSIELASRLSFFLWASGPDEPLIRAATERRLTTDADLKREVERMVKSPKVRGLSEEFFARWLGIRGFDEFDQPDADRFPEFTPALRKAMYEESLTFFTELVRQNRPLRDLVSADYAYLNDTLAKHYGIAGVEGSDFRRVKLKDAQRGGVLTQGSVLTVTSSPLRTSPVNRGKWITFLLLGKPTPEPPANVDQISPDERSPTGLSVVEQLKAHRANRTCAACHDKIDPPGLSLEHFDPIGRYRAKDRSGQPIVAVGESATEKVEGLQGLQSYLQARHTDLTRQFNVRLLEYALGRHAGPGDEALIERMGTALKGDDDRVLAALRTLVLSPQFRTRKETAADKTPGGTSR